MSFNYERNLGAEYSQQLPDLGQSMVDSIRFFGGRYVYGVGGDFAANLIQAFGKSLSILPSSNEMHAGFSACAQAELEGMGFCLTTYTVGSLPCMSAAALAIAESLPVIFISGAPGEQEVGTLALHHTVHARTAWQTQYDSALKAFAALGMKAERLQGQRSSGQPNMGGARFFELVRYAWENKQPVFVEVPRDQVFSKTQAIQWPQSVKDLVPTPQFLAGAELIACEVVRKLQHASAPVLFIGDGIKHNDSLRVLLQQFAERFKIPFATSWFAKGLFDEYHPLCLGAYNGVFSDNPSRHYIEQRMDYVLDVGSSIFEQDTNTAFATGSHFIQNFDNKTVLKGTAAMEGELVELFQLLLEADIPSFVRPVMGPENGTVAADEDKIDFHNLAAVLNELQQADTRPYLYLPEVGNSYFASYSLRVRTGQTGRGWLTNPWYGAMGTALPYARQAGRMIKDKQLEERAVVITGDGGMHFQANELIEYQKDASAVVILYMRNNVFHLGKSGDEPVYYCNHQDFDIHALMSAYGGRSCRCTSVGEFKEAFADYIGADTGISLIEIPAEPTVDYQCREITLLNLYIRACNGDPEAMEQWQGVMK